MNTLRVLRNRRAYFASACATCTLLAAANLSFGQAVPPLPPLDPQKVQDQDVMTWADYKVIPNTNWSDPNVKASVRGLRVALIAIDFPEYDFVITRPKKSDPFGNPQIDPIKRDDVAKFYADFWHKPSEMNHKQTIHGYWMEQSRGKYGIAALDAFGPYKMPHTLWYYGGAEHGQNNSMPENREDEPRAQGGMEGAADALWRADKGQNIRQTGTAESPGAYDQILRIYAGYDETSVWQEFGEMKFETREDITPEWGNPNPNKPRWVPTRYVPWTSWLAGMQQWGLSSIRQGESSGTIMHELGHSFFSTGDNNNNPYAQPYRRVGSGPWDMMDRGSFNGPGGPHMRWQVPVLAGGAMPAGLMLRQKINFGFLSADGARPGGGRGGRGGGGRAGGAGGAPATAPTTGAAAVPPAVAQVPPGWGDALQRATALPNVLFVSREGLAKSGLMVAQVKARAVDPGADMLAGIVVRYDGTPVPLTVGAGGGRGRGRGGEPDPDALFPTAAPRGGGAGGPGGAPGGAATTQDRTPWVDPTTDPLSPGTPNFSFVSLEVVQRIGYDSFTPDSGVLIAKNKDQESGNGGQNGYTCFNWVIDAHPEDINVVDYKKPKSGTPVMRTVADFRQLNDALFHAGLNSGSKSEWVDEPNRLKFYIINMQKDAAGVLSYTVGVKSLDGAGPQTRNVRLDAPAGLAVRAVHTPIEFTLNNTGTAAAVDRMTHPTDPAKFLDSDIYRLSVTVEGAGWTAALNNELATAKFGGNAKVPVFATHAAGSAPNATITLKATSESDPTKSATATIQVRAE